MDVGEFLLHSNYYQCTYVHLEDGYLKNSAGDIAYLLGWGRNNTWWPPSYYGIENAHKLTTDPTILKMVSDQYRSSHTDYAHITDDMFEFIRRVSGYDIREKWDFAIYFVKPTQKWQIVPDHGLLKLQS